MFLQREITGQRDATGATFVDRTRIRAFFQDPIRSLNGNRPASMRVTLTRIGGLL